MGHRLTATLALAAVVATGSAAHAQTATTLLHTGESARRYDILVVGDGFQNSEQATFDDWVQDQLIDGVFGHLGSPFTESMSAFNIVRVNADSVDSGVSQYDSSGTLVTARNTALGYGYNATWSRCWFEVPGGSPVADLARSLSVGYDYVIVVLNEAAAGGCRQGGEVRVTRGVGWQVLAHEMGHMVGGLCDEYVASNPTNYPGWSDPGCPNLTINTDRSTLKWGYYVDPASPLPTTATSGLGAYDIGAYEGGTVRAGLTFDTGLWHPSFASTMNANDNEFAAVDRQHLMGVMAQRRSVDFRSVHPGDFDGDGQDEVLVHQGSTLLLYEGDGDGNLEPAWTNTMPLGDWDYVRANDRFVVADFDGDRLDDLYVLNVADWDRPYFGMIRSNGAGFETVRVYEAEIPEWGTISWDDALYAGDFDGDGREDLYLVNQSRAYFPVGYLQMLRSTGDDVESVVRYDDVLPGWDSIMPSDRFMVGDADGDGRDDLYVFNGWDFEMAYLGVLLSSGASLSLSARYDDEFPGWDRMLSQDTFHVADVDGDGDDDLYVFNGAQWDVGYLAMLVADGGQLTLATRWDGEVAGWDRLGPDDRFAVADVNGDRSDDLYVHNNEDWDYSYLGILLNDGAYGLSGTWAMARVDSYDLALPGGEEADEETMRVLDYVGNAGWDDLILTRDQYQPAGHGAGPAMVLTRSQVRSVGLTARYLHWVVDLPYTSDGLW